MLAGLSVLSTGGAGEMAVVWGVWSSQGRLSKAGMGKVDVFFPPKASDGLRHSPCDDTSTCS